MADIKIRIEKRRARNLTPEVKLVTRNEGYTVEFEFDDEWSVSNLKTALFIANGEKIAVPFTGKECKIPMLVGVTTLFIGVKATEVLGLQTTIAAKVDCELSADDLTNEEIEAPSKSVYDLLIEMINAGMVRGEKGEKGDKPQLGVDYWTDEDKKEINDYIDKEIAEFDFVKVLDARPEVGLPNREYFIRKTSDDTNDLFEEWAWINKGTEESPNWGWEFKGTKKFEIDLSDYLKKENVGMGLTVGSDGNLYLVSNQSAVQMRVPYPVTGSLMDWAWKEVATNNQAEWKPEDWEKFYAFIGAVKDYHTNRNGIARFNNGKLDVTDGVVDAHSANVVNGRVLFNQLETIKSAIKNNYSVRYFDLGDNRDTAFKSLKLGANSMFIITENESYQASAKGSADTGGVITDNYDLLPHDKTSTIGKYYDVATTIFIISNGENSPYTNRTDMRPVIRMTLDGLSTSLKFFWLKEQSDGTVLTLSMKSSGQHRECVLLGNNKI